MDGCPADALTDATGRGDRDRPFEVRGLVVGEVEVADDLGGGGCRR